MLQAAFVTREYTPEPGIPFGRLGVNRLVPDSVHSPLMACLALFCNGDGMAGILTLDQNRTRALVARELREALSEVTGASPDAFAVAATHAHNAPILVPWRSDDPGFTMLDRLREHVAKLAREAVATLHPVRLRMGSTRIAGLAGCRRPVYRDPQGREQVGTHGPRNAADFVHMESPDEDELRVVYALDRRDTVCGGIANFPCHPVTMYSTPQVSADYPGEVRRLLRKALGGCFVFLTGPAGDQAPLGGRGADTCAAMGRALSDAAVTLSDHAADCGNGPVATLQQWLSLPRRELRSEQVVCATQHLEAVAHGERPPPLAPRLYGYAWHFRGASPAVDDWLAREILGLWEVRRRSETRHIVEDVEIQLLSLGGLRILALPGEPFGAIGRQLRDEDPCLLVSEQTNGHAGYLPATADAFERGGYECCLAQQSRFVPDAGPRILAAARSLLDTGAGGD